MRKVLTVPAALVLGAMLSLSSAHADPGPATHIDTLAATVGSSVQVSGGATFVDVPVLVGTDGADATNHGKLPSTNLTTATISRPPGTASSPAKFAIGVGNHAPNNGVPVVLYYRWNIAIENPNGSTGAFLLLANRAGGGDIASNQDPDFKVWTCNPDAPPPNCTETAVVSGEFNATGLVINVPPAAIGAQPGAIITATTTAPINVAPGASAAGVVEGILGASLDVMSPTEEYVLPGATVKVGIAPAGTVPESVELTKSATVNGSTGAFAAVLAKPAAAGDYIVIAEACYTGADCVRSTTPITV